MSLVSIYAPNAVDFSSNGLCLLLPTECSVSEHENGMYELKLVHPITDDLRWAQIRNGCIIKASVPMRESPLYEIEAVTGSAPTTVTRKVYEVDVRTRLMLRAKPTTSSKILGRYKDGTQVVRLNDEGNGWYKVSVVKGGAVGYMSAQYLDYVKDITETVTPEKPVTRDGVTVLPAREQLFRINSVEVDTEKHAVTATAMHIFYDLRGNLVARNGNLQDADPNYVARVLFDDALVPHDFTLTTALVGKVTGEYGYRGIVECLMYPDEGILSQTGGIIVRDNFDVFLLPKQVRDMGVTIRRGKNLIGVQVTTDSSDVVTRIIPVGKNEKGDDLYLQGTRYVDSPHIGDYPTIYVKRIEYDVRVGKNEGEFADDDAARAELLRLANADFAAGADAAAYGMEVDFITLGNADGSDEYASLQAVHIHDTVTVIDELIQLRAKLRVTGYTWDVLAGRYTAITLGDVVDLEQVTYGYTLPDASVSGGKIIPGSASGSILRDATIGYAKINTAAIEQLSANAITALRAHIRELVAGNITTDQLYADLAVIAVAQITTANIDKANINWAEITKLNAGIITALTAYINSLDADKITTDKLYASLARISEAWIKTAKIQSAQIDDLDAVVADIVSADIKTADIDYAQIKDLLAQKAIITDGVGGSLLIDRLAVTSANMLGATIGNLVLKSEDGRYYAVVIGTDGTIHTEEVTVTAGEIAAGQTTTGQQIVETTMNVRDLNAQNIKAQEAIIAEIFTSALTAGKITAGEAMIASAVIPELYVTTIRAIGESLELVNGRTNIIHRGETPPADAGAGDLWVQPGTGALFQSAEDGQIPEFYLDGEGALYYRYGEGQMVYALTLDENGDLYVDEAAPFAIAIGLEGQIIPWERVKDGELQAGIDENKEAIDGANKLIREQSAKITEMADAIDLRVTTKVYEEGLEGLGELIQKNEASITLLEKSITSKVSQEVYDEDTGAIREEVSEIKQTANDITASVTSIEGVVNSKNKTYRQSSKPTSGIVTGDIWINTTDNTMHRASVSGQTVSWEKFTPSELSTSSITISKNNIDIGSTGNINIKSGGSLNVNAGAAHFRTKEYTLAIPESDGSEDTVMDFDSESKALRVNEISAGNVRPYISGTTRVSDVDIFDEDNELVYLGIGGLDGLKGMLESAQYEYIIYLQTKSDPSSEPIHIKHSNSLNVEIKAGTDDLIRIPPLRFTGITGNVYLQNLKWSVPSSDEENFGVAVAMDSGSFIMLDCYIDGNIGLWAMKHARVTWTGIDRDRTTAGGCTTAAQADDGAEIKLYGLIPAGTFVEERGGTITAIDTRSGAYGTVTELKTESFKATVGYYGTNNEWNANELRQGYSNGKGQIYGCMSFEIPDYVKNVESAVLSLHRVKGTGKGSKVNVVLYGSTASFDNNPSNSMTKDPYVSRANAVDPGVTISLDVTDAAKALVNGTIKQLVLYNGDFKASSGKVYSSNYAMFDRAALKITY